MKVLLVDDNRLMLEGLQSLLEAHDVQVAGMAENGHQAIVLAQRLIPDVILMDIRMPQCDGLTATRLIKAEMPEMKIVILTTSTDDQDLFEAVKSGACGYLLKSINADTLIESLVQAQDGIPPFSPGLAAKLLTEFAHLSEPSVTGSSVSDLPANPAKSSDMSWESRLNNRQTEVLTLVSQGLSYKEVGARLYISPRTVRYHMVEIMNLLHMENRAQVLAYAGRLGFGQDISSKDDQ
ncbi:MAG: response regulator transcription factor [Bacillota bacterium]|nr:response regulator transcription factor [Bacillota bacterium]